MSRFGPTRGELRLRLAVGVGGLVLLAFLSATGALPNGAGRIEVLAISGGFFGGTAIWSLVRLRRLQME